MFTLKAKECFLSLLLLSLISVITACGGGGSVDSTTIDSSAAAAPISLLNKTWVGTVETRSSTNPQATLVDIGGHLTLTLLANNQIQGEGVLPATIDDWTYTYEGKNGRLILTYPNGAGVETINITASNATGTEGTFEYLGVLASGTEAHYTGTYQITGDNTSTPLVESDASLAEVINFTGANTRNAEIPAPTDTSGGTLTVSSEVAVTAGGTSTFNILPELPAGYAVQAYLFSLPGTGLTHVVYLGNTGSLASSSRTAISDLPETLTAKARTVKSLRTAQADPYRQAITASPMRLTDNYSTNLVVQAYVRPASEDLVPFSDFSNFWDNMDLSSSSWSAPAEINLNAVSVGEGSMQVTLTWDTDADIDLHLIEPSGNDIYWNNKRSPDSDGYLDVDDIDGFGPENVYFEDQYAPGTYRVEVHHYSGTVPTNYTVTIKNGSSTSNYSGVLSTHEENDIVTSFTSSGANTSTDSSTSTDTSTGSSTDNSTATATTAACGVDVTYSGVTTSMCFNNYPTDACTLVEENYQDIGYSGGTTIYSSCPSSYGSCIIDMQGGSGDYSSLGANCVSY